MKRILPLFLIAVLLTGCVRMSHVTVTPHTEQSDQSENVNVLEARDYLSLTAALLEIIEGGHGESRIRISAYEGDVEQDIADAVYAVTKQEPLGAYAVDYMTYECVRIVSYYDISVHTTYRRTLDEIMAVENAASTVELEQRVQKALQENRAQLTLQIASWWEQDITAMVKDYCLAHPVDVLQVPKVTLTVYPDSGVSRILEIDFGYSLDAQVMQERKKEVAESIVAAADYIRYRKTEREKAETLYTYLTGRFAYTAGRSETPLYGALCAGIADPEGLSLAWQQICQRADVSCYTVRGTLDGEAHTWNMVKLDGVWRHLDLAQCVLSDTGFALKTDAAMSGYEWTQSDYPACK